MLGLFSILWCVRPSLGCRRSLSTEPKPAMLRWQKTRRVASLASCKECNFAFHAMTWPSFWKQHHVFWKTSLCQTLEAEEVLCQQSQQRITATKVYMSFSQCILTLTIRHRRSWQHPLSASIMEGGWIWLVLVIAKSWKTYLCYCNPLYTYASLLPHRPWPVIPFS